MKGKFKMKNFYKLMDYIQRHEKVIIVSATITIGVVALNKILLNKGFTYEKLLKDNDVCSLITNIETLALKSPHVYAMLYDPDFKRWYITIEEGHRIEATDRFRRKTNT